jgi:hypothetical protein
MHNFNIIAFQPFLKFRALCSRIENYTFRAKRQNIIEDFSLVIRGKIQGNRVNILEGGLSGHNGDIIYISFTFAYGHYLIIMSDQALYGFKRESIGVWTGSEYNN